MTTHKLHHQQSPRPGDHRALTHYQSSSTSIVARSTTSNAVSAQSANSATSIKV